MDRKSKLCPQFRNRKRYHTTVLVPFLLIFLVPLNSAFCNPSKLFDEGNYYYVQEKFEKAIESYQRYRAEDITKEQHSLAQYLIGNAYDKLGLPKKAFAAYYEVEKIDSKSPWIDDSLLKIATMYARHSSRKTQEKAVATYKETISRFPDGSCVLESHFGLASTHFRLGNWKDAEKNYHMVLNSAPPDRIAVEVLLSLGDYYRTRGNPTFNPQVSISYYEEILKKYPKNASYPSTYLAIGHAYREWKQYQKALTYYKKVVDEYPDSPQAPLAQSMIGLCHEENSDFKQSLWAYNISIKKYSAPQVLLETVATRATSATKIKRLHKEAMHIEADNISYEAEKGKAKYSGNVRIFWDECEISCQKATAYIQKTFIIAEGKVQCNSRKDLKMTSMLLHFFPKEKKLKLYGEAQIYLVDPSSLEERLIIQGKTISYNLKNDTYYLDE